MGVDSLLSPQVTPRIFVGQGDFHFYVPRTGSLPPKLHTLLGSCVSIVLWHPERCVGGMCHCILPKGFGPRSENSTDARYCDGAVALFLREVIRSGTMPQQYHAYLVGGGRMYSIPGRADEISVGQRNVESARIHLKKAGFLLRAEDVEQEGHRKVELDLQTGEVTVVFGNRKRLLSSP